MLFLLTGDIQTGKTRWLSKLVEELGAAGAACAGVLAPGVWRERSASEVAAQAAQDEGKGKGAGESGGAGIGKNGQPHPIVAGTGRFEKLGIDNVLLPDGERVPFARRRDLAQADGAFHANSQSARAKLAWEIDDAAIERVNAHFSRLARADEGMAAHSAGTADEGELASANPATGAAGAMDAAGSAGAGKAQARALLVVDELGRLELARGEGLSEAMRLLQAGPSMVFPHAIAVVRESLLPQAHARLDAAWSDVRELFPDDAAHAEIMGLFR